jgi:hypothetical protein
LPTVPKYTNEVNSIPPDSVGRTETARPKNKAIQEGSISETRPDFETRNEKLVDTPEKTVSPTVPKLLPTPVSEQITAPKFSDSPEPVADISDRIPVPQVPLLPPAEMPPAEVPAVPDAPQQPLPDILVDPFIEDVGQSKAISRSRVALASSLETLPVNSLREGEPKRLSPGQKGIIARELAASRATRIIFKRYFDEKIEP